jgi:hypothetical protein
LIGIGQFLTAAIPGKTFILDTDASQTAIGAVLSQEFDEKEQVIAYMSKALNKAEQSYCVTRDVRFLQIRAQTVCNTRPNRQNF